MTPTEIADKLTPAQRRALLALPRHGHISPAELAQEMGGTKTNKAQGLGRLGGTMGTRLVRMKLALHASHSRGGFPAYAISDLGFRVRAVLEARGDVLEDGK